MTGKRSYFQDILSVFGSNLAVTGANLVIGVILSRILGAAGYGEYSSIIVVPMIIFGFTQLGIKRATIYHLASKKLSEEDVISSIFILLIISSILTVGISALVFQFSESKNTDPLFLTLVLMTVPLVLCNVYAGGIFLGKQQILRANILNAGPTVLNLVFVILFVWILKLSVKGAFLGLFFGNLGMFFYVFYVFQRSFHIKWKFHKAIMKSMVSLGVVFALSVFIMHLNYRLDIILMKKYSTLEQVGLYSLAVQIAEMLWHVPYAIETIVLTRSANVKDDMPVHRTVASIMRVSLILAVIAGIFLVLIIPYVIPLIFGNEFRGSVPMIQWIMPGIIFLIAFRILNSRLAGMGKPQVAIYTFLPSIVINVILNVIWIPKYGGMGAVWATNISYATGVIIFMIVYIRITKMSFIEILRVRKSDFYFIRTLKNKVKWKKQT